MSDGGCEGGSRAHAPPSVDASVPAVARMYDYALGGKNNFEADRRALDALVEKFPLAETLAVSNRHFLQRAVRHLVREAGIRQILDIGSGLPTAGNVHDVAHGIDPCVRVVYVDNDPLVLAHARALLADDCTTSVIEADATEPASIFDHPVARRYIDVEQPYAVLMAGLLHHLSDEQDPPAVTRYFVDRMVPGCHLVVANFLDDDDPVAAALEHGLLACVGSGRFRTWAEQRAYFDGLEMVAPGLVYADDWRPDAHTPPDRSGHTLYCAGVGRKV